MGQVVYPVIAIGSTDAADRAKKMARIAGYHVRTVASVRLVEGQEFVDAARQSLSWVVALAVREG